MFPIPTHTQQTATSAPTTLPQSDKPTPAKTIEHTGSDTLADVPVPDPTDTTAKQPGFKQGYDLSKLPTALLGKIGAMLADPIPYSLTSHHTRLSMQIQYWDRLTPACRAQHPECNPRVYPHSNPRGLYADYVNRQDRYLPASYLVECGVSHQFLINRIQKGQCSITKALGILQKYRLFITAAEKSSDPKLKAVAENFTLFYYVERGLLALERAQKISPDGIKALSKISAIEGYLENGELLMREVEQMTSDQMFALSDMYVGEYLRCNQLSMKEVLCMTPGAVVALRVDFVRTSLADKTLPRSQFLSLSVAARWAFEDPVVMQYLKNKQLNMQDILNLTECAYMLLYEPEIRSYLERNPSSMARILGATDAAYRVFSMARIKEALIKNEICVDDVLNISQRAYDGFYDDSFEDFIRDRGGNLRDYIKYFK